jgi:subtilisin-like proprotein convertase family protein/Mg-chelatase subunit ChlD
MKYAVLVLVLWCGMAWGDELRSSLEQPLVEVSHSVDIRVADGVATYKVRRQFANKGTVADEAGLAIDLPSGAAATGLRIRARDRWYDGELMEREKAAALYKELTGRGAYQPKDPALLQWLWADKLYLQVFPVLPGSVSTVEYTLTVPTRYANGRYWLSYPRSGAPLATPTLVVHPAWGDARTEVTIDGARVAPDTPFVLVPPVKQPWEDAVQVDASASYVASTLVVPTSSHTDKAIASVKLDVTITHTYQGDLLVELVTPQGKRVSVHEQTGGTKNDIKGVRTLALPPGTIPAGTWHLVVSDHAALDTGTIDRFALAFGDTNLAATDTPVFIPDAPESASDAGVAPIAVAPPVIDHWAARFGRVVASAQHGFARLEVDTAPQLSKVPVRAQVVFVVDASYSAGEQRVAAQLATLRAYLAHVPDAEVEVIAYRRTAQRVFGTFVRAADVDARLEAATRIGAFGLGNGSALDEGAKLAAAALAKRSGPKRVVLMSDELVRTRLTAPLALAPLAALAGDTVVHVVIPEVDGDDRVALDRDDAHALAKLATAHHGILAHLRGFPNATQKNLAPAVLELVRPTHVDNLAVTGGFALDGKTLHEGEGIRLWWKGKTPVTRVALSGQLWSDPLKKDLDPGADFSRATAAFVFGADEHQDLSHEEMLTVAFAGRAVTPVTSYVAYEPGTRPSVIGLEHTIGHGSGSGSGYGYGGGRGMMREPPDLARLIDTTACVRKHAPAAGWHVTLDVETTRDEIVDVATGDKTPFAACLVEATWAVRLPAAQFFEEREQFTVELGTR